MRLPKFARGDKSYYHKISYQPEKEIWAMKFISGLALVFVISLTASAQTPAATDYPKEVQKFIQGAEGPGFCEKKEPRWIRVAGYMKENRSKFLLIFMKEGEELEIWIGSLWWRRVPIMEKVFYRTNGQWVDKQELTDEAAAELDRRLKFTGKERKFLLSCITQEPEAGQ